MNCFACGRAFTPAGFNTHYCPQCAGSGWGGAGATYATVGLGRAQQQPAEKSFAELIAADNRDSAGVAPDAALVEPTLRLDPSTGRWYVCVQGALAPVVAWAPEAIAEAAQAAAKRAAEVWKASDAVARLEAEERLARMGGGASGPWGVTGSVGPIGHVGPTGSVGYFGGNAGGGGGLGGYHAQAQMSQGQVSQAALQQAAASQAGMAQAQRGQSIGLCSSCGHPAGGGLCQATHP